MDIVLLVGRVVVAAVFLVAGVTKLADLAGSRQAMRDFGVPGALAGLLGVALPIAEILLAVALIPQASAWWGALGALTLLLVFVGGIGYNLVRGRAPNCHCFGQLHSEPVGRSTLLRNGVLAVVAGLVVGFGFNDPGTSAVAWLDDRSTGEQLGVALVTIMVGAVGVLGWLLIQVLNQNGQLLVRLDGLETALDTGVAPAAAAKPEAGLPVGSPAPAFDLANLEGGITTLDTLRTAGKSLLLLFTDPDCKPCNSLLPDIGRWQRQYGDALTVAMVSRGDLQANRIKSGQHGIDHVLIQQDHEVAEAYKAFSTPTGVLVRPDGTIGALAANGPDAIRDLVVQQVHQNGPALAALSKPATTDTATNGHGANGSSRPTIPLRSVASVSKMGDPAS